GLRKAKVLQWSHKFAWVVARASGKSRLTKESVESVLSIFQLSAMFAAMCAGGICRSANAPVLSVVVELKTCPRTISVAVVVSRAATVVCSNCWMGSP
uniref:Uncharacterized protein n=1 Tax=Romanomermis culicivorax TaxID=13658 RepID=A0A915I7A0_ROMCU